MALTATATKETRKAICKTLGLSNPIVVAEAPDKPNIKYTVYQQAGTLEETFAPYIEEIRRCQTTMDRLIIFCRTYNSCARIYLLMKHRLGIQFTEPIGAPDLAVFRIVDMFSSCTDPKIKNDILISFCNPDSSLRVTITTIAFGIGFDCPNVQRVIHWGPSSDIELCLQETGRAGRDGAPAQAILYHNSPDVTVHDWGKNMKD